MNFPWTRHFQRYEYILLMQYVDGKMVADVGCGFPYGASALTATAKLVYAVDCSVGTWKNNKIISLAPVGTRMDKLVLIDDDLFNFYAKVDVITAVEVFEHIVDPKKFITHLSKFCENLFLTTPMVEHTGKTDNTSHVAEYSREDFDSIVEEKFEILDKKYQLADLSIVNNAKPCGSSINHGHVVQMAWCRRK